MNGPVYLRAIPRSGGTLFVTLLDAHPKIAMSYEVYEDRLFSDCGTPLSSDCILRWLERAGPFARNDVDWIKQLPDSNLCTFLFRARRGGLTVDEVISILREFHGVGASFDDNGSRLRFIDQLMQCKSRKVGKEFWGGKTQAPLYTLHAQHPDACFFIMVRDIRDVYASMLSKGSFTYTAEEAAEVWKQRIQGFRDFVSSRKPRAMEIRYEQLAKKPEYVLESACEVIGVEYSSEMLSYHKRQMTLFENPHGHLSSQQLQEGINDRSIGRWKSELTQSDIDSIMAVAGDLVEL